MYNNDYIDSIGENYFKGIIDGKIKYNFDINNINSKDQQKYYVFQHFLIKSYIEGYKKSSCMKYIEKMYLDFINKPYLFCDSPLLKNGVLQLFFNDKEVKNKILNFRDKYYNEKSIKELIIKSQSKELTSEEKNRYFSFLIVQLNKGNKSYDKIFLNEIKRILNTSFNSLTDIELKFYAQYISIYASDKKVKTTVMIGTDRSGLGGYSCKNYIFINKKAFNLISLCTRVICHETRHAIQAYDSLHDDTNIGFELAHRNLFSKYLDTEIYDSYHNNYNYVPIELDAEKYGFWKARVFFTEKGKEEFVNELRDEQKKVLDKRNYYSFMKDKDNNKMSVDKFIVTNLDKIISNNPSELNKYPVLKNIYNHDGTKKNINTIIKGRLNDYRLLNKKEMYDNYISYAIKNNELNDIRLDSFNIDQKKHFIQVLLKMYDYYINELKNYFKDEKCNIVSEQVLFATEYKLNLCYKLLSYVESIYNEIVSYDGNEEKIDYYFMRDFTYPLRDFDIDSIKNPIIKNSKDINDKIMRVKEKSDAIIKKYNISYINDKLDKTSPELKKSFIISFDGKSVNFEEYFRNYILKNMDGHQNINLNKNNIKVEDLINIYEDEALKNGIITNNAKNK